MSLLIRAYILAFFLTLGLGGHSPAYAIEVALEKPPQSLPFTMTYRAEPISPLCFRPLKLEQGATIPVYNCELGLKVTPHKTENETQQHRSYENLNSTIVGKNVPYYKYTYLGEMPLPGETTNGHLLLLEWSGGGTGRFSALVIVERDEDNIILRELLAQGDRCNHGLEKILVKESGHLSFHQNITPYDLFELGGKPDRTILKTVRPYTDLKACAACCYGTAYFRDFEFDSIFLDLEKIEKAPLPEDIFTPKTPQNCFDEALKILTRNDINVYTGPAWNIFVRGVEKVCFNHIRSDDEDQIFQPKSDDEDE